MVNMKTKHFETSGAKSKLDISTHSNTDDYNQCRNQSLSNNGNKTMINCPFNTQLILKKAQSKSKSSTTRKPNKEIETTTKIPRCGVRDGPLMYLAEAPWKKKSFTWKLLDGYHPSYGTGRTRAQIQDAFNDWARYAPLTFREVSQYDEADFELAFIHRVHDPIRRFDGPGGTLAYAYLPPSGMIRFEAEEPWKDDYSNETTGFNLHLVATHEIGHALGLGHSNDPKSIMFEQYQLFQPHELLPRDDRAGIQALYKDTSTPTITYPTSTRRRTYPTTTRRKTYSTTTRRRTYPTSTRRTTTRWSTRYIPKSSWRTVSYWPTTVWWTTRYSPTTTRRTVRYRSTTTSRPPSTWRTVNYWPTTVWWATRYSPATTRRTVKYRSTTTSRKTRYRTTTQWTTKYNPTVTMRTVRYKTKTTLKPTKYKSTTIKTTKKTKTTTTAPTRKTKITIPRSKTTKTSGSTWRYTTKRSIRTTTTSQPNKEWVRLWPTWTILYPKSKNHYVRYQLGSTEVSKKQTIRTTIFKKTKTTTTSTTAKIQKKLITTLPATKLKLTTTTTTTKSIPNKSKLITVSKSTEKSTKTTTMLPIRKITTTIERIKTLSTKTVAASKITTKLLKRTSTIASEKAKILTTNPVIVTKNNTNVSIRNTKTDTTRKTTTTMTANKTATNTLMKTITTQPTIIIGKNEQVQLNFDEDHYTNIYQHET
ncbi:unnamed protein product [Adineta steineri]|uniref:Peptidase metallopeptidase domain-containing protein n=1 Tax=Adineta steineri TaxID=433720 RepID=A0A815MPI3_9BILA|nr:unnamed protein product [Adineta steineri]CAF1424298.1 unnamed protein product [Adineta steineri]CAF1458244.1 unnamed protein product [Adineta steineri]